MIFIIGCQGRLGQALSSSYPEAGVTCIDRATYQNWWQEESKNHISDFFAPYADSGSIIFVTSGILDPKSSHEEHMRVNYLLPKHIIDSATKAGLRVVTFGTVMESLIKKQNSYIETKTMLGNYVANLTTPNSLALHVRIHTLYGSGQPSPFMFLGQIHHALVEGTIFEMTSGKQLREYHHIEDEVKAIRMLVDKKVNGVLDLSHGEPVSLKDIASYVFSSFNCEKNLRIGALPEPAEENYGIVFQRPDILGSATFRESLPAIRSYIQECLQEAREPA